ncbi:MAG: ComEA family DNA-binding protein [Solirubrobacteraceae bacterium]|nr:ComEA family DNA-binding protein [Patulibacter sp.]
MWIDAAKRWGRGVLALALLGVVWLLAGPKEGSSGSGSAVSLSGPGLGSAKGAVGEGSATAEQVKPRHVVVHVAGAVHHPGVYKVRVPGRLIDAVRRAGGLTDAADLTQVNLAAHLTDGRAIIVPSTGAAGVGGAGGSEGSAPGSDSGIKLSLNTATEAQLEQLDGVGPSMAAAIVKERTKLGGFSKLDQLDDVPGVGAKRLASLQEQLEL